MNRRLCAALLLLALLPALGSCGVIGRMLRPKPKPDKEAARQDVFVGTIEMVNPEHRFVLIRTGMRLAIQAGAKLETRPNSGTRSVLSVSPEQKLNFLSADIAEGYPQKGEIVVLPAPAAGTPETAHAPPAVPPLNPPGAPVLPPPIP